MGNVLFLRTRIEMIGSFFGPEEVDEIWLTFPDPQLKKKRKRLTSPRFLNTYCTFLKKNGIVHLKTDSNVLYRYTLNLIEKNYNHQSKYAVQDYAELDKEPYTSETR